MPKPSKQTEVVASRPTGQEIFSKDYIASSKGTELIKRLKIVFDALVKMDQMDPEAMPPGLENIAAQLVRPTLLNSASPEIQSLTCCALVEILRIYAPTPPYDNRQMLAIFKVLFEQFQLLTVTDGSEAFYDNAYHIVESLASVRSICIIVELLEEYESTDDGDNLVNTAFKSLLTALPSSASKKLIEYASEIVVAVVEELADVSASTLEVLLQYMAEKQVRPAAMEAVALSFRRMEDKVSVPVANTINHFLSLAEVATDGVDASKLSRYEYLHRVIVEVVPVLPLTLLLLFPRLVKDLDSDELPTRRAAVCVMGQLFALPLTVVASEGPSTGKIPLSVAYSVHFQAWIRRFRDKESIIRKDMCGLAGEIIKAHTGTSQELLSELSVRLTDPDDNVRRQAVATSCDVACVLPPDVCQSVLSAVALRVRDKSVDIRRDALTGLAQIYAAHMPAVWAYWAETWTSATSIPAKGTDVLPKLVLGSSKPSMPEKLAAVQRSLAWIPAAVVSAYDQNEAEIKGRVLQLLENVIVPASLPLRSKGIAILTMFNALDEQAKETWKQMIVEWRALQQTVTDMLRLRLQLKKDASTGSSGLDVLREQHAKACISIAERLGNRSRYLPLLHGLSTAVVDNKIFKQLAVLADSGTSHQDAVTAADDCTQRIKSMIASYADSKSGTDIKAVGELLRTLVKRLSLSFIHQQIVGQLVEILCDCAVVGEVQQVRDGMQLLLLLAKQSPALFSGLAAPAAARMAGMMLCDDAPLAAASLKIFRYLGQDVYQETFSFSLREQIRVELLNLATTAAPPVAKNAASAACSILAGSDGSFSDTFFRQITDILDGAMDGEKVYEDVHYLSKVACVEALARHAPAFFGRLDAAKAVPMDVSTDPAAVFNGRISRQLLRLCTEEELQNQLSTEQRKVSSGSKRKRPESMETPHSINYANFQYAGSDTSRRAFCRTQALHAVFAIPYGRLRELNNDSGVVDAVALSQARACVHLCVDILNAGGDMFHSRTRDTTLPPGQVTPSGRRMSPKTTGSTSAQRRRSTLMHDSSDEEGGSSDDDSEDGARLTAEEAAVVRLAAGRCAVKLSATDAGRRFDKSLLDVANWLAIGRVVLDADTHVRTRFVALLQKYALRTALPFRHLAYFAYAALDPRSSQRKLVKEALPSIFAMHRRAATASKSTFLLMPEYVILFVVYMLAHDAERLPPQSKAKAIPSSAGRRVSSASDAHSDSEGEDKKDDGSPFREHSLCLSLVYDCMLASLGPLSSSTQGAKSNTAGSISLMFAILRKIRDCSDAVKPEASWALHALADVAFVVLKRYAKDAAAFAEYPGEVRLPASLFRVGAATSEPLAPAQRGVPSSASRVASSHRSALVEGSVTSNISNISSTDTTLKKGTTGRTQQVKRAANASKK